MTRRVQAVKRAVNHVLERTTGYRLVASPTRTPTPGVLGGLVEEFAATGMNGWVVVPAQAGPVRVSLVVNEHEVAATWATDGVRDAHASEKRPFAFALKDIWSYCKTSDNLSVRVGSSALPISGHGMFVSPNEDGPRDLAALLAKLRNGHVFSQTGRLQLSKARDTAWQANVMALYGRVRTILREDFDYDAFLIYGTLLGAVRERGIIGHDLDFDAAYVSRQVQGPPAAAELRDIAFRLIERGLDVDAKRTALHIRDPERRATKIDLFHLYFDQAGLLQFPFGVAGSTEIPADDWRGTREIDFCGTSALIPANAEQMVEHIYGPGWRSPKPGFDWGRDRTKRDMTGLLPVAYGEEVYWSNFYARNELGEGTPFFKTVSARPDVPRLILDIGCGDGRDALAFAASGRTVLGLDRSAVAVEHATARATRLGLSDRAQFAACDVSDADAFRRHVERLTDGADGPMLFYLRFFLHSIPEDVQESLLSAIRDTARSGDMLAAEFRTKEDEQLQKVFPKHYRRYQDGPAFGSALRTRFGFQTVEEEEGRGLSPYGDEDPYLYRVVARRR